MDPESFITEEIQARIGVVNAERRGTIAPELARRTREMLAGRALEETPEDVSPAVLLGLAGGGVGGLRNLTLPPNSLIVGDQWEWRRPLRLGETVVSQNRLSGARERFGGRLGHSLILSMESVFLDEAGQEVAVSRQNMAFFKAEGEVAGEPGEGAAEQAPPSGGGEAEPATAREGDLLPERELKPSLSHIVRYCALSWVFEDFFYDPEAARAMGMPAPIVPGPLKLALLSDQVLAWAGPKGVLKEVRAAHRRPDHPGRPVTFGGQVMQAGEVAGGRELTCEVWFRNQAGERSLIATAVVELAS